MGYNDLGAALYGLPVCPGQVMLNLARFFFLDPRSGEFFRDRDRVARNTVAMLRSASGSYPQDAELRALVDQLSTGSDDFRRLWADQDVLRYRAGLKRFRHPLVGDMDFSYNVFALVGSPGLSLVVYTSVGSSETVENFRLLASWTEPSDTHT